MTYLLRRASARRLGAATAVAAVMILASSVAHAFCRTTTVPVPPSYSPTRGCFTDGIPLFWKGACVGYTINNAASVTIPLATATSTIDAAFNAWNEVTCAGGAKVGIATSDLGPVTCDKVNYNSNGPNQNVIIFHDDTWPYNDPNNTLGLTTVTYNADTGEIYDADMELNATARNLSATDNVPPNGFDLLSVVTHEAGHFLGLAHATDARATMFASYKPGTSALRTLFSDDIAGICDIYPNATTRAVATGTTAAESCDPTPRHGFGSTCAANPPPSTSNSGCAVSAPARGGASAALLVGLTLLTAASRRRCRCKMV